MVNDRVEEVMEMIWTRATGDTPLFDVIRALLPTLPEFAPPKAPEWIQCSERMPEVGQKVFWYPRDGEVCANGLHFNSENINRIGFTHWMPRFVPAPPVQRHEGAKK